MRGADQLRKTSPHACDHPTRDLPMHAPTSRACALSLRLEANPELAAAKKEKNDACRERRKEAGSTKSFS